MLCRREEEIQKGVAALQKERQALEACVLSMSGKTVALERWLEENEAKMPQGEYSTGWAVAVAWSDNLSCGQHCLGSLYVRHVGQDSDIRAIAEQTKGMGVPA